MSESSNDEDKLASDPSERPAPSAQYQEALDQFVQFWGEMASKWGINRTMAQIHALLYSTEEPLDTDDIMQRLEISRGNANMNLRSLTAWNLVEKVHQAGSRKDYYTAKKDVWEITAQIIKERQRREIKPVKQQLQACRDRLLEDEGEAREELDERARVFCERIDNLVNLVEVFEGFSQTLLPFVKKRNIQKLRQFLQFAEALQAEAPEEKS